MTFSTNIQRRSATTVSSTSQPQEIPPTLVKGGDEATIAQCEAIVKGYGRIVSSIKAKITAYDNAFVSVGTDCMAYACDWSKMDALDGATVFASDNATISAFKGSTVEAMGRATVDVYQGATVTVGDGVTAYLHDGAQLDARKGAQVHLDDGTLLAIIEDCRIWAVRSRVFASPDRDSVQVVHGSKVIETESLSPGHHAAFPVYASPERRKVMTFDESKPHFPDQHAYPQENERTDHEHVPAHLQNYDAGNEEQRINREFTATPVHHCKAVARNGDYLRAGHGSEVTAVGNSWVSAGQGSTVSACDQARVIASHGATVKAMGNATVTVLPGSVVTVGSTATARLYDGAQLEARKGARIRLDNDAVLIVTADTQLSLKDDTVTANKGSVEVDVAGRSDVSFAVKRPAMEFDKGKPYHTPMLVFDKSKPYWSMRNPYPPRNYNCKFKFPEHISVRKPGGNSVRQIRVSAGSTLISCRHLSTQYIHDVLHSKDGKVKLAPYQNPLLLGKHVATAGKETDYENMLAYASEAHLIDNNKLGELVIAQFEKAEKQDEDGKVRALMIGSTNHAMAIRLRMKAAPDNPGKKIYVVSFYDPNSTDAVVRLEVNDLSKLKKLTLRQLVDGNGRHGALYESYFPENNNSVAYVCTTQRKGAKPLETNAGMKLTSVCSEKITPGMMHLLMDYGFAANLTSSASQLAALGPEKLLGALGQTREEDGKPWFAPAFVNGDAKMIRAFVELLKRLPNNDSKTQIIAEMLAAGAPAFYMALQEGDANMVRAFGELLDQFPDNDQRERIVAKLLAAKSDEGVPGLYFSVEDGKIEAIQAFGKLLELLPVKLRAQMKSDFLNGKFFDEAGAVHLIKLGNTPALQAFDVLPW